MPEREIAIVVLPLAPLAIVVPASYVHEIDDATNAGDAACDVAALLDLEAPTGARRAIRAGEAWLIVGETIVLRSVPVSTFRPLPAWLAALGERYPVSSIVRLENGFAFELDVDRAIARDHTTRVEDHGDDLG